LIESGFNSLIGALFLLLIGALFLLLIGALFLLFRERDAPTASIL
jgi:hypothetical protein